MPLSSLAGYCLGLGICATDLHNTCITRQSILPCVQWRVSLADTSFQGVLLSRPLAVIYIVAMVDEITLNYQSQHSFQ